MTTEWEAQGPRRSCAPTTSPSPLQSTNASLTCACPGVCWKHVHQRSMTGQCHASLGALHSTTGASSLTTSHKSSLASSGSTSAHPCLHASRLKFEHSLGNVYCATRAKRSKNSSRWRYLPHFEHSQLCVVVSSKQTQLRSTQQQKALPTFSSCFIICCMAYFASTLLLSMEELLF
jgi:hypothetical protein